MANYFFFLCSIVNRKKNLSCIKPIHTLSFLPDIEDHNSKNFSQHYQSAINDDINDNNQKIAND